MHHYSLENYDKALEFLFDEHRFSGKLDRKENFERRTEFQPIFLVGKIIIMLGKILKKIFLSTVMKTFLINQIKHLKIFQITFQKF